MKQWHCSIGGQQYGPVSEEDLRSWAVTGRIKPTDYVWSEGMMDRSGEGMTQAGMICGIIGTIIGVLWVLSGILSAILWIVVIVGFGVAGGFR